MKLKILMGVIATGCILGCVASLQTLKITGTVCSCTSTEVTVQEEDGAHYDIIQRTSGTIITGTCSPGKTVTVQYMSTDAQRKQGPCPVTPTTAPTSN